MKIYRVLTTEEEFQKLLLSFWDNQYLNPTEFCIFSDFLLLLMLCKFP